ncbi:hypothetical protein [Croceitalea dokdonensis]|nr:hypothetical protein [Croceitalea dokdonensis]
MPKNIKNIQVKGSLKKRQGMLPIRKDLPINELIIYFEATLLQLF